MTLRRMDTDYEGTWGQKGDEACRDNWGKSQRIEEYLRMVWWYCRCSCSSHWIQVGLLTSWSSNEVVSEGSKLPYLRRDSGERGSHCREYQERRVWPERKWLSSLNYNNQESKKVNTSVECRGRDIASCGHRVQCCLPTCVEDDTNNSNSPS